MKRRVIVAGGRFYSNHLISKLESAGIEVVFCSTADEVLNELTKQRFDCVITNLLLPHGNSFMDHETNGGTHTGKIMARKMSREYPELSILILSHESSLNSELLPKQATIFYPHCLSSDIVQWLTNKWRVQKENVSQDK